jgi:hypothetical protein
MYKVISGAAVEEGQESQQPRINPSPRNLFTLSLKMVGENLSLSESQML